MSRDTKDRRAAPAPHAQGRAAVRKSGWRRFQEILWPPLRKRRAEPLPVLNEAHDRAEDRLPPQPAKEMAEIAPLQLKERLDRMDERVRALGERVDSLGDQLDDLRFTLRNPTGGRREAVPEDPGRMAVRRTQDLPPSSSPVTGESFERALCRALGEQSSSGLEIESLLADVRRELGGLAIRTDYLGQSTAGRWQVALLWLPAPSDQGFAVAAPGGLADAEVMKFFEVEYGRRIFNCSQPARVRRDGKETAILRKGRVESS